MLGSLRPNRDQKHCRKRVDMVQLVEDASKVEEAYGTAIK